MLPDWRRAVSQDANEKASNEPVTEFLFHPTSATSTESDTQCLLRKRSRALADVDGDNSDTRQRKKRRLRRDLITSRLSMPYASPATHIISRNAVKLGVWTGRRYLGRNVFRRAAILNSMRRDKASSPVGIGIEIPKAVSLRAIHEPVNADITAIRNKSCPDVTVAKLPSRQGNDVLTPVPSPITTNYDIFDDEDTDPDAEDCDSVTILEASDSETDDLDDLFSLDSTSVEHSFDPPPKQDGALESLYRKSRSLMGG